MGWHINVAPHDVETIQFYYMKNKHIYARTKHITIRIDYVLNQHHVQVDI